jgi:hypothetical protein
MITALFTEAELETVRRCCRDADAPNPLRCLAAALARAELPSPRASKAGPIPSPTEWHDNAAAALAEAKPPLPPHPGKR